MAGREAPLHIAAILKARQVPLRIQRAIVEGGDLSAQRRLLYHRTVAPELIPGLVSNLLGSNSYPEMCAAVHHSSVSAMTLADHLFSDDVRIAAAASDRIGLANDLFRLSDYAACHAGHAGSKINSFLNSLIERRLPLGQFVLACFLLRPAYPNDPQSLLAWIQTILADTSSFRLRAIVHCSKADHEGFQSLAQMLPEQTYRRLLTRSLRESKVTAALVHDLAAFARKTNAATLLARVAWRRMRSLRDLVNWVRQIERLAEFRSELIRPF